MHVAATLGAANADNKGHRGAIYANGIIRPAAWSAAAQPGSPVSYAGKSAYADALFKGRMAELRIWTRPHRKDELRSTMNRPLVGNGRTSSLLSAVGPAAASQCAAFCPPEAAPASPWPAMQLLTAAIPSCSCPAPARPCPSRRFSADFTAGFTLEAWVYCDEASNWARIIELGNGPGADNIVLYRNNTSNRIILASFAARWPSRSSAPMRWPRLAAPCRPLWDRQTATAKAR